jgi:hypothetical protein
MIAPATTTPDPDEEAVATTPDPDVRITPIGTALLQIAVQVGRCNDKLVRVVEILDDIYGTVRPRPEAPLRDRRD